MKSCRYAVACGVFRAKGSHWLRYTSLATAAAGVSLAPTMLSPSLPITSGAVIPFCAMCLMNTASVTGKPVLVTRSAPFMASADSVASVAPWASSR